MRVSEHQSSRAAVQCECCGMVLPRRRREMREEQDDEAAGPWIDGQSNNRSFASLILLLLLGRAFWSLGLS